MATKLQNMMAKLQALEGAVLGDRDPHEHVLDTPSPSFNFIFGNGWGLPEGFTAILYGPPRAGKTITANMMIGRMHQKDPEGVAIKFDTEMRETGQLNAKTAALYGIDRDRYVCYSTNDPVKIFDRINNEIAGLCQQGMKLKLVIIDSMSGIRGRRDMNADTLETQQIGDEAATLTSGFKRLLEVQRKYGFAVILTAHVRAEFDKHEIMRGNKNKMQAAFAAKHYAEYYIYIEQLQNADSKKDLTGKKFEDASYTDMEGKAERVGHKIKATMKDSSLGPKGRIGSFTFDYNHGIINTHEEVFLLGYNRKVIVREGTKTYCYKNNKWNGKVACLEAIKADPVLAKAIVDEIHQLDRDGVYQQNASKNATKDDDGNETGNDDVGSVDDVEG